MTELAPGWPMDRVLTDEMRSRIMRGYRRLLSTSNSTHVDEEITEVPLDVDVILLEYFDDNIVHAQVFLEHGGEPTLVTDEVEGCPHHSEGDQLSTLADLGEEYADLEKDLLEVSALMCDLPEFHEELDRYAVGNVAFQNLTCDNGLLTFTFAFRVADVIVQAYQDYEYELGERVGIPIEPSVEELLGE